METKILSKALPNKYYTIKKINIENKELIKQLNNIGFSVGRKIKYIGSNFGKKTFLVKVMDINFGIDKQISEKVEVADA